ncbi:MAG: hypothetical protein WBV77_12715, partial [Solirubrobacteraceae bacterium]
RMPRPSVTLSSTSSRGSHTMPRASPTRTRSQSLTQAIVVELPPDRHITIRRTSTQNTGPAAIALKAHV